MWLLERYAGLTARTILFLVSIAPFILVAPKVAGHVAKPPTLAEAFHNARVVALMKITKASPHYIAGSKCGTEYRGSVARLFSGRRGGNRATGYGNHVLFGRSDGLQIGRTYLLFLRWASVAAEMNRLEQDTITAPPEVQRSVAIASPKQKLQYIQCGGLVPGLEYDNTVALKLLNGDLMAFGLWPKSDLPNSIRIDFQSGPQWLLRAHDVFAYLDTLDTRK